MSEKKVKSEWIPKLSVVIRPDQYQDLTEYLPWGLRSHIFQRIVDDLLVVLKSGSRDMFIAAMLPPKNVKRMVHLADFNNETADAIRDDKK